MCCSIIDKLVMLLFILVNLTKHSINKYILFYDNSVFKRFFSSVNCQTNPLIVYYSTFFTLISWNLFSFIT